MAKNSITDYDNTAANNTDVQSVDISEGCSPSGINNAIREVMADLADVNDGTVALESPKFDSIKDGNITPPDASGTDVAGTDTTIKGGAGTGTGAGGSIIFQTADGGSTGSSVNSHATAMTIDSSGRITKPNQPRFYAKMASDIVLARATYTKVTGMTGNSIDVGSNFDGTEFVAPVAGDYYFSGSGWIDFNSAGVDGETVEMEIRKNSTAISVARFRNHTTKDLDDIVLKTDVIVTLAANDTIQLWVYSADNDATGGSQTGKATLIGGNGTYLLGYLIG